MKKTKSAVTLSLSAFLFVASSQTFAAPCTPRQIAALATRVILQTERSHFSGPLPKTWTLVLNPPVKTRRIKGRDEYAYEMLDEYGYVVPVYLWVMANRCDISASGVYVDWKHGDDG